MSVYPYPVAHMHQVVAGPTPPPVAGYSLWLDTRRSGALWADVARTTPAANLGAVASWFDPTATVAAERSTTSQRPIRDGTDVAFDGLDDSLEIAAGLGVGASGLTILVLARIATDTGSLFQFSSTIPGSSGNGPGVTRFGNILYGRATNGIADVTLSDNPTTLRSVVYRHSGTEHSIWINGALAGQVAPPAFPTQERLMLGSWYGGFAPLSGAISRVVVYPSGLSDAQIAALATWAAS